MMAHGHDDDCQPSCLIHRSSGGEIEGLFQTLSHGALGTQPQHGQLFEVYASRSLGALYWLPLNPKWASISSGVFRKRLKKSVRFSSTSLPIGCRLRHKTAFYEVINVDEPVTESLEKTNLSIINHYMLYLDKSKSGIS